MKCFILCAADDGRRIAYFATRRWVRRTLAALEREEALHIYHTNSGEGSTRWHFAMDEWEVSIFEAQRSKR